MRTLDNIVQTDTIIKKGEYVIDRLVILRRP